MMPGHMSDDPFRQVRAEIERASKNGDIELIENILHRHKDMKDKLMSSAIFAAIDAKRVDVLE